MMVTILHWCKHLFFKIKNRLHKIQPSVPAGIHPGVTEFEMFITKRNLCDGHHTALVWAPFLTKIKIACIRFSQLRQQGFILVFLPNTLYATQIKVVSSKCFVTQAYGEEFSLWGGDEKIKQLLFSNVPKIHVKICDDKKAISCS